MISGFRQFFINEDKVRGLKKKKENYLQSLNRELSISPNAIPDRIETGEIELDGLYFNQAVLQVIKPIDLTDKFIKVKLDDTYSPNLDQQVYRKTEDGQMTPYVGSLSKKIFLVPIDKFAELISKAWQSAGQGQQGGGGLGGGF